MRMIANDPGGELAGRITATQTALTVVENCATDDQTRRAIRKARKQVKNGLRTGLGEKIARIHAVDAASESSSGAVTTSQEGKKMAREALQLMLFLNLLKFGEMFARQPEKLDLYMRQGLLEDDAVAEEEPAPPPPTP
jgi:hypothetical protein